MSELDAAERIENDRQVIPIVLTYQDEGQEFAKVDNSERLGRFDQDQKGPRIILERFKTDFVPRKVLAKAYLMKDNDIKNFTFPRLFWKVTGKKQNLSI